MIGPFLTRIKMNKSKHIYLRKFQRKRDATGPTPTKTIKELDKKTYYVLVRWRIAPRAAEVRTRQLSAASRDFSPRTCSDDNNYFIALVPSQIDRLESGQYKQLELGAGLAPARLSEIYSTSPCHACVPSVAKVSRFTNFFEFVNF